MFSHHLFDGIIELDVSKFHGIARQKAGAIEQISVERVNARRRDRFGQALTFSTYFPDKISIEFLSGVSDADITSVLCRETSLPPNKDPDEYANRCDQFCDRQRCSYLCSTWNGENDNRSNIHLVHRCRCEQGFNFPEAFKVCMQYVVIARLNVHLEVLSALNSETWRKSSIVIHRTSAHFHVWRVRLIYY